MSYFVFKVDVLPVRGRSVAFVSFYVILYYYLLSTKYFLLVLLSDYIKANNMQTLGSVSQRLYSQELKWFMDHLLSILKKS